ncbi:MULTISPECIES: TrmH family RNA methyltransferase [Bacillus]|uniref:RNA methyltransferase n=1 Tax=Bacillus pumilus TaxID=1408 RepID=A0A2G8IVP0_BACPU|nr:MULTISPECIES: RNA methyltransferase [Bacillus]MED1748283.1 RNA methyltransferase [Bacillus zhangzhouensis]PIK27568.1 RNA methyltransferase [Bacillus pumilus]
MKYIESAKNASIKQWKKLHTKKERTKTGLFLVEGKHLVEEALKSGIVKELMVTSPDMLRSDIKPDIELYELSEEAFSAMTETETPQHIAAICTLPVFEEKKYERILLLDAVQDPGNLGTLIRTADAAGLDAVILGEGTVDAFNGKTLRSAQGSHFHLPILKQTLQQAIPAFKEQGIPVYGSALKDAKEYRNIAAEGPFALIVGNEGAGIDPEILQMTDQNLYVPMYGQAESLNVAVAAAVLVYHLRG